LKHEKWVLYIKCGTGVGLVMYFGVLGWRCSNMGMNIGEEKVEVD
jgi:hypothetical protein